jgi:3-dehydroquinate synthase
VAIGLALDTRYSVQVGLLPLGDEERVVNVLHTLGFSLWHEALELRTETGAWKLLDGLKEFQEHMGGELTITLLREIGSGEEVHQMEPEEILLALAWLHQREPRP